MVAAAVASGAVRCAEAGQAPSMPTRRLGRTDLQVPILEVGGTYRFTRRYVERALALGCNFFDTAAEYVNGWSEKTLGQSIRALDARKRVTVVTKGYHKHPESLAVDVNASRERLGFDTVDIYYMHDLDKPERVTDPAWKAAAEALKRENKIRFFGFSCHNDKLVPLLNEAAKGGFIDVIMFKYNFRSYGDADLNRAIDVAHKAGIGLIAMKTQGSAISFSERVNPFQKQGFSKHQAVLKAVWKDDRLASAVSCMPSIQVLEQNAAAANQKLSAVESELLQHYAEATKSGYCPGGCGGCHRECESATGGKFALADTLRFLMYHDSYGLRRSARNQFSALDQSRKCWDSKDLHAASQACPRGIRLAEIIPRADRMLSHG